MASTVQWKPIKPLLSYLGRRRGCTRGRGRREGKIPCCFCQIGTVTEMQKGFSSRYTVNLGFSSQALFWVFVPQGGYIAGLVRPGPMGSHSKLIWTFLLSPFPPLRARERAFSNNTKPPRQRGGDRRRTAISSVARTDLKIIFTWTFASWFTLNMCQENGLCIDILIAQVVWVTYVLFSHNIARDQPSPSPSSFFFLRWLWCVGLGERARLGDSYSSSSSSMVRRWNSRYCFFPFLRPESKLNDSVTHVAKSAVVLPICLSKRSRWKKKKNRSRFSLLLFSRFLVVLIY